MAVYVTLNCGYAFQNDFYPCMIKLPCHKDAILKMVQYTLVNNRAQQVLHDTPCNYL